RLVGNYCRRRLAHLNLGAHFLDLRSLLSELGCELRSLFFELRGESLYLFLLLRDRCLQLLNFVIQLGLALGERGVVGARGRLRCATFHRCATRRYATTLVRAKIPAKVAVCKVQSNLTNGGAVNRLEVIED